MMKDGSKKVFEYLPDAHGVGNVFFAWSNDYNFLAVCGENRNVYVINRKGKKLKEVALPNVGKVVNIDWDKDNEFLCVLQEGLSMVTIWNVFVNDQLTEIDVGNPKEKATFAKWSKTHPVLAIGTDKGGLIFYNKRNQRRIPTIGKHTKRIIGGDWNKEGHLLTGAEDKLLTVSSHNADTVFDQMSVKAEPHLLRWARQKTDDREATQRTIVSVLNKKTILMFQIQGGQPLELVFEQKYGNIVDYSLFGDGYIVVGFNKGWVAHISTHINEIKDEVDSKQIFQTTLDALATNDALYKLAVAGENTIRFFNLNTWNEIPSERIELPKNAGKVVKLEWVSTGQLLIASTASGQLYGYLTAPFSLNSVYGSYVALLTSFTEVTIFDCTRVGGESVPINNISLEIEPGHLANGPYHVGVAMNNLAYFHRWYEPRTRTIIKGGELRREKDYFSSIKKLAVNSYWAAALTDGKCYLHPIEQNAAAGGQDLEKRFPNTENEKPITYMALSEKFLIMLDATGRLKFFQLEDQALILEYKTDNIITKFHPCTAGTRLVCNGSAGMNTVFVAADDTMIDLRGYPAKTEKIIWDSYDSNQFLTVESEALQVFTISKHSLQGPTCTSVKEYLSVEDTEKEQNPYITNLDKGVKPLVLNNGYLFFLTPAGTIQGQYLASHSYLPLWRGPQDTPEGHYRYFLQSLSLLKFSNCLVAAGYIDAPILYTVLGKKCLENLELDIAYRSYQKGKNLSMVLTIESFKHETETNILLGNVAMIFGLYDVAENFFLKSSKPSLALDMRCDIQDWSIALNLAKSIAPEQEQLICRRLATQVESQGNNAEALRLYEKALIKPEHETRFEKKAVESHNLQCYAGIARSSIKLGDVGRGLNITNQLEDNQQIIEIAMVCENTKNFLEAAQLYEKSGLFEKAASIYITLRIFNQATQLISKIKSPKLLVQLAKAKESEGAYKEAEDAYERAEDWENVIKINLTHLDNVKKAKDICKNKCPTQTCAKMIANHLNKKGPTEESIEFLVLAGLKDEAFTIAISTGNIEAYVAMLKDIPSEEALKIAQFLEGKNRTGEAAKYYEIAGNPLKALKLFIQSGSDNIPSAIELVARVKTENLTHLLLDYLVGETDDVPKDPKWTFRLYMALGDLQKAARIALTIANDEQERGNYKAAHAFLYETQKELKEKNLAIPWDLYQRLLVLHSYVIVKRLVKMKEDETAARMLSRVCKNISQFPAHDVRILTSAAFQGMKAGLKGTAYQWALALMAPEYRSNIAEEHRKKIETIVRKPTKEEPEERLTACPFCREVVPETQLECGRCQNNIAYCIASGKHINLEGCAFCPNCDFPAIAEQFRKSLEVEGSCPMCEAELTPDDVREVSPEQVLEKIRIKKNEDTSETNTTRDTTRTEV